MSDNLKLCSSIKFNWLTIPCTEACCTRQEAKASMYTHLSIICLCRDRQSSTCGWVVRHLSITYLWLGCRSPVKNIYLWLGCQSPVNHSPVTRLSVICGSPTCDWAIESLACDWAVSHHLPVTEPSVTCQITCESLMCDWAISHLSITYLWLGCQSPVNHLPVTGLSVTCQSPVNHLPVTGLACWWHGSASTPVVCAPEISSLHASPHSPLPVQWCASSVSPQWMSSDSLCVSFHPGDLSAADTEALVS